MTRQDVSRTVLSAPIVYPVRVVVVVVVELLLELPELKPVAVPLERPPSKP